MKPESHRKLIEEARTRQTMKERRKAPPLTFPQLVAQIAFDEVQARAADALKFSGSTH